jgi:hypothetical protein
VVRYIKCGFYNARWWLRAIKCVFYYKDLGGPVDLKANGTWVLQAFVDAFCALGGQGVNSQLATGLSD